MYEDAVIKTGLILKKGDRSSNYSKRCAVLLFDRIVIYEKVGDPIPLVSFVISIDFRLVLISIMLLLSKIHK